MADRQVVRFNKDQVIFKEGDLDRDMYVIQKGSVKVYISRQGKAIPIAELERGNFVGEMSFLSGVPRTATVIARGTVVARRFGPEVLEASQLGVSGWALAIARILVTRLRRTSYQLADYMHRLETEDQPKETPSAGTESQGGLESSISEFSLHGEIGKKEVRIYLKGDMRARNVEDLQKEIRRFQTNINLPVVIDFSDVVDLDKASLNYVFDLTRSRKGGQGAVRIDNVQLLKEKVLTLKGIQAAVQKAQLPVRRLEAGDYLIRQGDEDNNMYFIRNGSFTVMKRQKDQDIILGTAEAGDVVGEMALIRGGSRSASVKADKGSVVAVIDVQAFYQNTYNVPRWFMELIRGLVFRLRNTNALLSEIVEKDSRVRQGRKLNDPLFIELDGTQPEVLVLQGALTFDNLEYLAVMVDHLRRKDLPDITLDLSGVETLAPEATRYLINTFLDLRAQHKDLHLKSPPRELKEKLRQEQPAFLAQSAR